MRLVTFSLLFYFNVALCFGQVSLEKLALKNGKFGVGFRHYVAVDSARTYQRIYDWNSQDVFRPVPVSIWYPSVSATTKAELLKVLDYLEILKEEEEWEHLPSEQILNWFYYPNTPANQKHLPEKTKAFLNAKALDQKFPVVIYAPSYQASSIENFALCAFLASHGYVVIASPSRGTENRFLEGGTEKDMETQARDIEFLVKEVARYSNADLGKIATMGFSFGGLSNVLAQMRNGSIKAIVSLDGSIKYQYPTLQKSPFYNIAKVDVPFIHFAQKNIPKNVLIEDKIDSTLDYKFDFYDSLTNSRAYRFKFNRLTHSYFSTLGVLFQARDPRQDKSDAEIMESYTLMSEYTLHFLNGFLKSDKNALLYLEKRNADDGQPTALVSKEFKLPVDRAMSFEDFNEMARKNNYQNLARLYEVVLSKHSSFKPEEGKLNNLGLQLLYNPTTSSQGVDVLNFATKLYPESANLFDSLAEAYLFVKNEKQAVVNFEKSLQLNPANKNASDRLKMLEGKQ